MLIKPGTYLAKITSDDFTHAKNGNLQRQIGFEVKVDGAIHKIYYYGYFSEAAQEYTIKNLITLGLKGNNPGGEIDMSKQVELVIEVETYEGKERSKIKFINEVGSAPVRKTVPRAEALAKLSALQGAVMSARAERGSDDSDLPF